MANKENCEDEERCGKRAPAKECGEPETNDREKRNGEAAWKQLRKENPGNGAQEDAEAWLPGQGGAHGREEEARRKGPLGEHELKALLRSRRIPEVQVHGQV